MNEKKYSKDFIELINREIEMKKDMDCGLSIAKGIIDKYNGEIKACSKDGFTSFIIKLSNK